MKFAKIDFINLLPFHIYIKKNIQSSQLKAIITYKKSYPSDITQKYKKSKVDSAFISSVSSKGEKALDLGIVAKGKVLSVLLIPGKNLEDFQSKTSNALAKVLNLKGEVLIGDKALKYFYDNKDKNFIDLAAQWENKYNLPFVFARLCYRKNGRILKRLTKNFNKRKIKIPQYILKYYEKRSGVSKKNITEYLKYIHYDINIQEKKSLKKFLTLAKNKGLLK